jgi:hypothetical protein
VRFIGKDKVMHPGSLLESGADPALEATLRAPVPVDPELPAFVLRTFDYNLESKLHAGTSSEPGQPLREKVV